MKRMLACMAVCVTAATPVSAALSGYWDSSKVLHALLGHDGLADGLRQQPIETITKTDQGYRVTSQDCTVDVTVTRTLPDRPGPTAFSLTVGQAQCD